MKLILSRVWLLSALCLAAPSCTSQPAQNTASAPTSLRLIPGVTPPALQFSWAIEILLPSSDGKLHYKRASQAAIAAQSKSHGDRTIVLNEIIRLSPGYFPKGSRVRSVDQTSNHTFAIDLNKAFGNQNFWLKRNRSSVRLALYAFVNLIAPMNLPKGPTLPVQLTIEGKTIRRLGRFDTSRPLKINEKLIAKRQAI